MLLLLVALLYGLLHLSTVQTWLVKKIASNLSEELDTRVTLTKVNFRFFDKILLKDLMVEDRKKDTLLFAGTASVNITDWFFLKDTISLNNVGLEDAIINMHRTDSVWNYQFLVDYFSGPSNGRENKKQVQLNVKEVHLKNIRFNKTDEWVGQAMQVSLQKLDMSLKKLDVNKKQILFKDIYLENPIFQQRDFEGNRPVVTNMTNILAQIPIVSAFKWNKSGWVVTLDKLQIFDGTFINDKYTQREPYSDRFDGQHIRFDAINGSMQNVIFVHDTLHADVNIKATERSGLQVNKLQSHLKFTPEMMEFKELTLETNKSRLGNYYSMGYHSFNKDMSNFIHDVKLQASFKESVLSSDDLAIFAPALSNMKRVFYMQGDASGSIDNFTAKNMIIRTHNSVLNGNLAMRGLPNIQNTFIDLQARLFKTNYNELVSIIPALRKVKKPAINKLGAIGYTGNFTGFLSDFVAYGDFTTALGNLKADLNMKLPEYGEPVYSGSLQTNGFALGQFLNTKQLGNVALTGTVKGRSFTLDNLNADFKGEVARIQYGGYTYQDISINGNFKNDVFKGRASINDPNIQISRLDGSISLSGKELAFNADADMEYINLSRLGITRDPLTLAGRFSLNFTGNNIDNFLGTASVYDAKLRNDSTLMSFDSLMLRSYIFDSVKTLTLQSNEIDATLKGDFKVLELPDAFKIFLAKYYPAYIKPPTRQVSNQDFSFDIKTNNVDEYIQLFDKKLHGFNNARLNGNLNLGTYGIKINAFVPEFSYDKRQFLNTTLLGNGNRDTLYTDILVDDIIISDSMHFPDTKLSVAANNNLSLIKLTTSAGKTLNNAELNASILSLNDGVRIHFFPSSFVINNKTWLLEKDGELTLRNNFIDASEVKFVNEEQEIVLSTELDEETSDIHLNADLRNVVMQDFLPFFVTKPVMTGLLTGKATVSDPLGRQAITFEGIADSFALDGKYIGRVNLDGNVNTQTGLVRFNVDAAEPGYVFDIDGNYNYKDSSTETLVTRINAGKVNLNMLEPYLGTIFSKINGTGKGNLVISGSNKKNMTVIGDVIVDSGSLTVAYTQCRYNIRNEAIRFGKNEIDLSTIQLTDTLGNSGLARGKMYHHFFDEFSFEGVRVETGKMLLLNTTSRDNSQFYGNVIGSAVLTLSGPTTALAMNISGEPSPSDSSHIYLNTNVVSRETGKIDYIDYVQFGTEMDATALATKTTNILVNMDITANPACKVDVILDEETGDVIKGEGSGKLNLRVGTTEALSIRGRYDIRRGEYTFNFQTFVQKPFELTRGSITWNGDPLLAIIDIDAEYLAKNVDVSSLTQGTGVRRKEDITIISTLSGNLAKPEIEFQFKFPQNSDLNRDYYATKKLADIRNNENEMYKQVASLLLVNAFISETQGFITGSSTLNIATSTIGGVISGYLTSLFNKELERATNGVISTYFDINPSVDLQTTAKQLQANVRAGLKIFFSGRLNLILGGNLDYNNPYLQQTGLVTPDITLEWLLTKDGSVRVVGFNKTSTDLTSAQRNRSGVRLSYQRDFDNFRDFFRKRKPLFSASPDTIQVRETN